MSNIHNEVFLEESKATFDERLSRGWTVGAATVIDELMDRGFTKEANQLKADLKTYNDKEAEKEGETF